MKIIFKILAIATLVICFFSLLLTAWIQTNHANLFLEEQISKAAKDQFGLEVKIEKFDLTLFSGLFLNNIELFDDKGKFSHITKLQIKIIPANFLLSKISFSRIYVEEMSLLRIPTINKKISDDSTFFASEIDVKKIKVDRLLLSPEVSLLPGGAMLAFHSKLNIDLYQQFLVFDSDVVINADNPALTDLKLQFAGNYNLQNKILNLDKYLVDSELIKMSGEISMNAEQDRVTGQLIYKIRSNDSLSKILDQKSMKYDEASGDVSLRGKLSDINIIYNGQINKNKQHKEINDIKYKVNINLSHGQLKGNFSIIDGKVNSQGKVSYVDHNIKLNDFKINGPNLEYKANLAYNLNKKLITGTVDAYDNSMHYWQNFIPAIIGGQMKLKAVFSHDNKNQTVKINSTMHKLKTKYGDHENLNIKIDSPSIFQHKFSNIDILSQYFSYQNILVKQIDLNAKSTGDTLIFNTNILSRHFDLIELKTNGKIDYHTKKQITISGLKGFLGNSSVNLQDDLTFSWLDGFNLKMNKLVVGDGFIHCDYVDQYNKFGGNLVVNNIKSKIGSHFFSGNLEQVLINGDVKILGTNSSPLIKTDLKIKNIASNSQSKDILFHLTSSADQQNTDILLDINKEDKFLGKIKANLPYMLNFSDSIFKLNRDRQFNVEARLTKDFNSLSLLPKFDGQVIEGYLDGKISWGGTLNNPRFIGKAALSEGVYSHKTYGVNVKNVKASIISDNKGNLLFRNIEARDRLKNLLSGSGSFNTKAKSYNFTFKTNKFHPMNNLYVQGAISGEATYIGNFDSATVKGDVQLGPLEIKIPEKFQKSIPELNVVNMIDKTQDIKQINNKYKLYLDLNLATNNNVFVRGRGVNAQLSGKLKVSGNYRNANVEGKLRSTKGTYKEFGKILNVERSVLLFEGPIIPSPYLNIIGVTNVDGKEIQLILTGSIIDPVLKINSSPYMSKEKVLSLLLFGVSTDKMSQFQAVQLADAVRRLSGKATEFDPIGFSKKILRIDDINLRSDSDNPDHTYHDYISVGKYLYDKIYVEIEQGVQDNSTKTKIQVELTPAISIENVNYYDRDNSIGINWKHDY